MEAKEYILVEDLPEISTEQILEIQNGSMNSVLQGPKMGTTTIVTSPRKLTNIASLSSKTPVKILPKTATKTTPGKMIIRSGRSPIRILPRPNMDIAYDISSIQKFSTAWRCSICQKISSTKKIAMAHLRVAHSKAAAE
eukprot:GFUD01125961.1.p1 GENE.GFUD01125961.1~~GFUD01125961.1.p1  ORF type:complete len:146 (+),score=26.23 GFUD01125961.1:24-440(+)